MGHVDKQNKLIGKIVRFYNSPFPIKVREILNKLPFHVIYVDFFLTFEYESYPYHYETKDTIIREANLSELDKLLDCYDKGSLFEKRLKAGEHCIAVFSTAGQVLGYAWVSTDSTHVEERFGYELCIPNEAIYIYDVYIDPQNRGKGLWKGILSQLRDIMEVNGRRKIVANVDLGNNRSIHIHEKYGFNLVSSSTFINLFGLKILNTKKIANKSDA